MSNNFKYSFESTVQINGKQEKRQVVARTEQEARQLLQQQGQVQHLCNKIRRVS